MKIKTISSLRGFTLIELMVTVGVIGITGTIILSILTSTLRLGKKADSLIVVKQNGNFALTKMVNQIRYAKDLEIPVSCNPPVSGDIRIISNSDNEPTTFSCSNNTIASNGASLIDTNAFVVKECLLTCSQQEIYDPPTITIKFTLSTTNSNFVENISSIPFQTSVTMRNYSR